MHWALLSKEGSGPANRREQTKHVGKKCYWIFLVLWTHWIYARQQGMIITIFIVATTVIRVFLPVDPCMNRSSWPFCTSLLQADWYCNSMVLLVNLWFSSDIEWRIFIWWFALLTLFNERSSSATCTLYCLNNWPFTLLEEMKKERTNFTGNNVSGLRYVNQNQSGVGLTLRTYGLWFSKASRSAGRNVDKWAVRLSSDNRITSWNKGRTMSIQFGYTS